MHNVATNQEGWPKELEQMKSDACYRYVRKNGNTMNCCTRFGLDSIVLGLCSCNSNLKIMLEKCVEFLSKYCQITWTPELGFVVNCYEKALKDQFEQWRNNFYSRFIFKSLWFVFDIKKIIFVFCHEKLFY